MKTDRDFLSFSMLANASVRSMEPEDNEKEKLRQIACALGGEKLKSMSVKAKMLPFLAKLLLCLDIDKPYWQTVYDRYADRNRKVLQQLHSVYEQLHAAGCKKVFVSENFGAMLASGSDIALFASGDIDNYADAAEYPLIKQTLLSCGYTCEERFAGNLFVSATFENPGVLPEGFAVGFEVFPLSRLTQPCTVCADDFVDWDRLRTYQDTQITLPPADALLYICLLHISLHSFCRAPAIRLYRDIVNSAEGITDKDWQRIVSWAKRDRTERRAYTAAAVSNEIAGTKLCVPTEPDCNRLLGLTFDRQHKILRPEPSKLRVMKIEAACNDGSLTAGFRDMIFPAKEWMDAVYGGHNRRSRIRHIRRIL